MMILRKLLFQVARRAATDERVHRAAADAYRNQVKPRAQAAWKAAEPHIKQAKTDIGKIGGETNARNHPARFAGKVAKRIFEELKSKSDKN